MSEAERQGGIAKRIASSLYSLKRARDRIPLQWAKHINIGLVVAYLIWETWRCLRPDHHTITSLAQLMRVEIRLDLITVGVVSLLLWIVRERPRDLGFQRERIGKQLLVGLGAGLLILVADTILASTLTILFPLGHAEGAGGLAALFKNPWNLPVLLLSGVVGGGGVEELTRVFILTRFRNTWGRAGLIIGILIEATVFGLGHLYQGWIGAVSGAFTGLLFALVWLRKGRIVEAMSAHACEDVVGLSIGFAMGHL